VRDVVGYNTLGHCFFFEDGNEQDNVLVHNLGLVTKPGSLWPPDRNEVTCKGMAAWPNYVPDTQNECMHVSTYWISHPNNIFINNSAAGSSEVGYYFAFYRGPVGPSVGTLPDFHSERSGLPKFEGNRAHSNRRTGLLIDNGIKTTDPTESDPRDFQALIEQERYAPHENRNLSQPRLPARIIKYTAYSNRLAAFIRGGDVWISDSKFTDNDVSGHGKFTETSLRRWIAPGTGQFSAGWNFDK
jgi:cell migration-inducing and hyaluronan-binding protein